MNRKIATPREDDYETIRAELIKTRADLDKTREELNKVQAKVKKLLGTKRKRPTLESVAVPSGTTALIIMDMQNDFCTPEGSLFVGPSCTASVPHLYSLLDKARAVDVVVIYTQDWHAPDDPEFTLWPVHCVRDTEGAEVVKELEPIAKDYSIKKTTYDAFFASETEIDLATLLKNLKIDTVIVTGTVSNICVMHMVAGASLRGFRVVVPIDCISALNDYEQELALHQMSSLYRAEITTSTLISFT